MFIFKASNLSHRKTKDYSDRKGSWPMAIMALLAEERGGGGANSDSIPVSRFKPSRLKTVKTRTTLENKNHRNKTVTYIFSNTDN